MRAVILIFVMALLATFAFYLISNTGFQPKKKVAAVTVQDTVAEPATATDTGFPPPKDTISLVKLPGGITVKWNNHTNNAAITQKPSLSKKKLNDLLLHLMGDTTVTAAYAFMDRRYVVVGDIAFTLLLNSNNLDWGDFICDWQHDVFDFQNPYPAGFFYYTKAKRDQLIAEMTFQLSKPRSKLPNNGTKVFTISVPDVIS